MVSAILMLIERFIKNESFGIYLAADAVA